jgi:predicted transcriptional regulator
MELLPYDAMTRALREKRRDLDIQQQEVARRADISPAYLSRIEKGTTEANYSTIYNVWEVLQHVATAEQATAADLMSGTITWIDADETVREARSIMLEHDFSQLPVRDGDGTVGRVTERLLLERSEPETRISTVMGEPFLEVSPSTSRDAVSALFSDGNPALLVRDDGQYCGIITPMDLI